MNYCDEKYIQHKDSNLNTNNFIITNSIFAICSKRNDSIQHFCVVFINPSRQHTQPQ
jgi:hypothetical protein